MGSVYHGLEGVATCCFPGVQRDLRIFLRKRRTEEAARIYLPQGHGIGAAKLGGLYLDNTRTLLVGDRYYSSERAAGRDENARWRQYTTLLPSKATAIDRSSTATAIRSG